LPTERSHRQRYLLHESRSVTVRLKSVARRICDEVWVLVELKSIVWFRFSRCRLEPRANYFRVFRESGGGFHARAARGIG